MKLGSISGAMVIFTVAFAFSCSKKPVAVELPDEEDAGEMHALAPSAVPVSSLTGDAKAARDLFTLRCVMCHGWEGRGDGPSARMLGSAVKMPNFTNAEFQKTQTDETWATVIVKGGEATGRNRLMTANPDLADKPGVVKELVVLLRSFSGRRPM